MIKKVAIVPFVTNGRNSQAGHDGHLNFFKKKRSAVLKENLENALLSEKLNVEVIVDVNHGDLQGLKREGVDLMLIPEEIVSYIDYTNINKKEECYKLSGDEYEDGEPTKVVEYIKRANGR